jgi:hypothetical protein
MRKLLLLSAILAPLASHAQLEVATNYSSGFSQTNQFNTNSGYLREGSSLDGQPTNAPSANQWQTTDPYNAGTDRGSTSLVNFIANYTPLLSGTGNNSVYYGGYNADSGILPGITNPSLYYSFTQSGVFANPVLLQSSTFSIDFAIIGPSSDVSPGYTNKDYFGFSLLNSAGSSNLAKIRFNPFNSPLGANGLLVEWQQNGTNVVTNGTTFKGISIQYDTLYRLTASITNAGGSSLLDLSIAGLQTQQQAGVGITNYAVVTNQSIISGGALSGALTLSDFGRASLDWELSSGDNNNPGANYMIMTASSIISQAIPEPGTWAAGLALLSGVAIAIARRRRSAANV